MEAMRNSWTDERLDDFRSHVDQRFDRVEAELTTQRHEVATELSSLRKEMGAQMGAIQRLIIQVGAGTFGTLVLTIFTMFATR
jgi:hypothetical protein